MIRHRTSNGTLSGGLWAPSALALVIACLGTADAWGAKEMAMPDAATILDKFVEVTGGKAAYAKVHNSLAKGRLVHVGMGFEDRMTAYECEPNLRYIEFDSEALGNVQTGTDGKVVWYLSENTGPVVEEDEARAAALNEAAFDRVVQWRKYYKNATCVGEETAEGKQCYKIVMTPNVGEPETRFYDEQSNLLVRAVRTRLTSLGPPMPVVVSFSDYKRVGDLVIAHTISQESEMCGDKRETRVVLDSIEHNVEIPPGRFDPPAAIQAHVKKTAAQGDGGRAKGRAACCGSQQQSEGKQPQGCAGSQQEQKKQPGCGKP